MFDIESFIRNLTSLPGVYSMINAKGDIIYVGKAKNLKKRVSSYFQRQLDNKTLSLVKQIANIEVTITRNEREALLLESNLIKNCKPRYNIVFRDDKSYPSLYFSIKDSFPRLCFHRGEKKGSGKYFGPYPSAKEAREALAFIQGLFKLRQCDNAFFKSRKRPCLQYQIKRCSAPCVGFIDALNYQQDVDDALLFLEGKSDAVIQKLIQEMNEASKSLHYETSARKRDQIALLRKIQEQQIIIGTKINSDIIGIDDENNLACIHLLVIREGRMLGSRHYFQNMESVVMGETRDQKEELIYNFIMQHYLKITDNGLPDEILLPISFNEAGALEEILTEHASHAIRIYKPLRGLRLKWLDMAMQNAEKGLLARRSQAINLSQRFGALQEALKLEIVPERVECFDVSHTQGEATVAACVVFDVSGPVKSAYRRFNITGIQKGDDYGALKQALLRRYTRLKEEGGSLPDVLLIDGGKGQLSQAVTVLTELQVSGVIMLGIAKGLGRRAEFDKIYQVDGSVLSLREDSRAMHLIQSIRDEAHRFAITSHRQKRDKKRVQSKLEDINGVGKVRRLALLEQFGGLEELKNATVEEIAKVPGISIVLAKRLYKELHDG